jgi:hypothetical protein
VHQPLRGSFNADDMKKAFSEDERMAEGPDHNKLHQTSENIPPSNPPPTTAKSGTETHWEPPSDGTAYIGLAYALRQYPNSTEFVYLRRLDKDPTSYNPYALDVVPFAAVDPNDFYTMSVRGVTHYINGFTADFTNLDQWEREYQLFNAMCTLHVFNKYKVRFCFFQSRHYPWIVHSTHMRLESTHFDTHATHTNLDQSDRERQLFNAMCTLQVQGTVLFVLIPTTPVDVHSTHMRE